MASVSRGKQEEATPPVDAEAAIDGPDAAVLAVGDGTTSPGPTPCSRSPSWRTPSPARTVLATSLSGACAGMNRPGSNSHRRASGARSRGPSVR